MTQFDLDAEQAMSLIIAVTENPDSDQHTAGRVDDLNEVVRHAERLIAATRPGEDLWPRVHFYAAWARDDLHALTGEAVHLDRAIEHLRAVVADEPSADRVEMLVDALGRRHFATGAVEDLDEAVVLLRNLDAAAAATTDDERIAARTMLGLVLARRFEVVENGAVGELADLTDAIRLLAEVEPHIPSTDPDRSQVLATLGNLHVMSHLAPASTVGGGTGDEDLDRGIDLLRRVVDYDADIAVRLANALNLRYQARELPEDRDEAIDILERLRADPDVDLDMTFVADLGELHLAKLRANRTVESYERAITCLRQAWRHEAIDPGVLATMLIEAFALRRTVRPEELDWLDDLCTGLLEADDPAPRDPMWTTWLGVVWAERAARTDDPAHLRIGIDRLVTALRTDTALDSSALTTAVLAAAIARLHSGQWPSPDWSPFAVAAGDADDEAALFRWVEAQRDRVPADAAEYPWFIAAAALFCTSARQSLAQREGDVVGAHEASIAELERAREYLSDDFELKPLLTLALGQAYANTAQQLHRPEHSERAIALLSAAAPFLAGDADRALCFGLLGITAYVTYTSGFSARLPLRDMDTLLSATLRDSDLEPDLRAMLLVSLGQIRGIRWLVDQHDGDMRGGLALHEQALRLLPPDSPTRVDVRFSIGLLLLTRTVLTRNLDDITVAETHLRAILPEAEGRTPGEWASGDQVADLLRMTGLLRLNESRDLLPDQMGELEDTVAELSRRSDHDYADNGLLDFARFTLARHRGDIAAMCAAIDDLGTHADSVPEHVPFKHTLDSIGDMARASIGLLSGDQREFEDRLDAITARLAAPDIVSEERTRLVFLLGGLLRMSHTKFADLRALDRAIDHLRQAYTESDGSVEPFAALVAETLSDVYWARGKPGDVQLSISSGFDALRQHARQVLLHAEVTHGTSKASAVAGNAHLLAHRCVEAGLPDRAVHAVESGRGLAMHAASASAGIGTMLRELGHETTALQWEHGFRDRPDGTDIPNDLRFRVLDLLAGTAAEQRLLSPPTADEIAAALVGTGAHALVYLVAGVAGHPGQAMIVGADGRVGAVPLPLLDTAEGGEISRYLTAYQRLTTTSGPEREFASRQWRAELDELVRWAWPAVVAPLFAELARLRLPGTPHLVLVPCGSLGVVPWHAARDDSGGTPRFALQKAVFSYVASARQLCEAAARPGRDPVEDAVVVADPTGDLFGPEREARYLYKHCYPDSMLLGQVPQELPRDGPGTPEEVLAQLPGPRSPGASMLHLACHAAGGAGPAESYVELWNGERLTVERVLEHTGDHPPNAPGGLIVLAACRSDLPDRDHDEALTLATAFLAAGAATVVGTRWAVDDATSAVFMCLFHRYLAVERMTPAYALRAAQLWALDPHRVLPAEIATELAGYPTDIPPTTWAAFTHQGR